MWVALRLLMLSMQNINSWYCHLQSSMASQEFTIRKQGGVFKSRFGRRFALMDCIVQHNILSVIIMLTLCVFLTPCA